MTTVQENSALATPPLMTTEELLAMPDDGMDRELIRGELREKEMTRRNPTHSGIEARTALLLGKWLETQPEPRGRVLSGEAGFRLRRNPDTTVGIDVAYVDAVTASGISKKAALVEGVPVLAVEIISPSDKMDEIMEKVQEYLACGTKIVWLLETVFETLTAYRPDAPPLLLSGAREVDCEPHLPGFRCAVDQFFKA